MDQASLLAARPAELASAAEAYHGLVAELERLQEEWSGSVAGRVEASGWHGGAGELATTTINRTTGRLHAARMELALVRDTLREAAEVFLLAQSRYLRPGSDGSTPTENAPAESAPAGAGLAGAGLAGDVLAGDVLAEAERADRTTADRLTRLAATALEGRALDAGSAVADLQNLTTSAGSLGSLLAAALPAPGTPPERVADWWRALGPAGRAELTTVRPELIGGLDGLPARDRDRANRLLLTRLLDRYEHLASPDRRLLAGLRSISRRLAAERGDDVLLLALSDQGQGRGVLSFGDPDTADDVAVYVPGFGTELAAVGGGDADRAQRVGAHAAGFGTGRRVASMVWLGYDPPPNEGVDPRSLAVAGDTPARAGAAGYDRFLAGLRAARPGPPAHVTAIGHSYGSLLVGLAAQQPGGPAADEVVLVGSPGTGASRAGQLGVGAGHVYVGAADCDPVSRLPGASRAVGGALTGPSHALWFGEDPASGPFGARRFEVAPGSARNAFASHSAYFDDSSESLANIARVVAGRGDEVTTAPGR